MIPLILCESDRPHQLTINSKRKKGISESVRCVRSMGRNRSWRSAEVGDSSPPSTAMHVTVGTPDSLIYVLRIFFRYERLGYVRGGAHRRRRRVTAGRHGRRRRRVIRQARVRTAPSRSVATAVIDFRANLSTFLALIKTINLFSSFAQVKMYV